MCARPPQRGGAPLLLLNGLGAPLELWSPLLAALPVSTIAFDAPGSGGSEAPAVPMSISEHARLALDLLDHLEVPRADVLGPSFGGMVAQALAHLAPRRIERVVLASTSCGWGGIPGNPAALLALTAAPGIAAAQPRGYVCQFWAAASWSSLHLLGELSQPVLVLAGENDAVVPPLNAQILATRLRNAKTHLVRGGGHLCLLEHAEDLAPLIAAFLRRDEVP